MQVAAHRIGQIGRAIWFVAFEEVAVVAYRLTVGNRAAHEVLDFRSLRRQRDVAFSVCD